MEPAVSPVGSSRASGTGWRAAEPFSLDAECGTNADAGQYFWMCFWT
jgi:hypothetical protein